MMPSLFDEAISHPNQQDYNRFNLYVLQLLIHDNSARTSATARSAD